MQKHEAQKLAFLVERNISDLSPKSLDAKEKSVIHEGLRTDKFIHALEKESIQEGELLAKDFSELEISHTNILNKISSFFEEKIAELHVQQLESEEKLTADMLHHKEAAEAIQKSAQTLSRLASIIEDAKLSIASSQSRSLKKRSALDSSSESSDESGFVRQKENSFYDSQDIKTWLHAEEDRLKIAEVAQKKAFEDLKDLRRKSFVDNPHFLEAEAKLMQATTKIRTLKNSISIAQRNLARFSPETIFATDPQLTSDSRSGHDQSRSPHNQRKADFAKQIRTEQTRYKKLKTQQVQSIKNLAKLDFESTVAREQEAKAYKELYHLQQSLVAAKKLKNELERQPTDESNRWFTQKIADAESLSTTYSQRFLGMHRDTQKQIFSANDIKPNNSHYSISQELNSELMAAQKNLRSLMEERLVHEDYRTLLKELQKDISNRKTSVEDVINKKLKRLNDQIARVTARKNRLKSLTKEAVKKSIKAAEESRVTIKGEEAISNAQTALVLEKRLQRAIDDWRVLSALQKNPDPEKLTQHLLEKSSDLLDQKRFEKAQLADLSESLDKAKKKQFESMNLQREISKIQDLKEVHVKQLTHLQKELELSAQKTEELLRQEQVGGNPRGQQSEKITLLQRKQKLIIEKHKLSHKILRPLKRYWA